MKYKSNSQSKIKLIFPANKTEKLAMNKKFLKSYNNLAINRKLIL